MKVLQRCGSDAKYHCDCGCDFWTDPCTEENLFYNGEELIPQCPSCRAILIEVTEPNLFCKILGFPLRIGFLVGHFFICLVLTMLVYPERKCYEYYEYYAPWGWGERKDCPY